MDKAEYGHELNVGDIIEVSEIIGQGTRYKVYRVTKKYAFVMWNEVGEGKFPRIYICLGSAIFLKINGITPHLPYTNN